MKTLPLVFLLVGIGFLVLGGYLLMTETAMGTSPSWMRMGLGGLLIIYGIFRLSTSIGAMKKNSAGGAK
jgi:quinol-cytochrome oxidoreductase complex cytochrome b subunit